MEEEAKKVLNDEELDNVDGGARSSGRIVNYTVIKGDTLEKLAHRFRTTINAILSLNPIITDRNLIRIGWVLRIPDNR